MINRINKTKKFLLFSLPIMGMMTLGACKDEKVILAHCDSQFFYEGTPFNEGDQVTINPTFVTGEKVKGQFSANPGLVFLDREKGTIDIGASVPGTYMVRKAMLNNADCGGRIQFAEVRIVAAEMFTMIQDADALSRWNFSGSSFLDSDDKKQGSASVKMKASSSPYVINHSFASPFDSKVTMENGEFRFWLYVSNADIIDDGEETGQVELTSSGKEDNQELTWSVNKQTMDLKEGWNEIRLPFSSARISGEPVNLSALNFFRVYIFPKGGTPEVTIGLDNLRIYQKK